MTVHHSQFTLRTAGRGTYQITGQIASAVRDSKIRNGIATVFIRHTSASLIIFENADPSARTDLEEFFKRLAPDGADWFEHTMEGPDDMPAHLRAVLTRTSETIPIHDGGLDLGTWQGIFLCEHRKAPHSRTVALTILGE